MEVIYPIFISFCLVFFSELGDKTQLLVLSFSTKDRAKNILLGVALGTFFSHGLAILFGSKIASFSNANIQFYLNIITYISFLLFGIIGFIPKTYNQPNLSSSNFLNKITNMNINSIFIVALSIIVGELGDKTFLASLGLGLQYPNFKIFLITGSILGMVASNYVAIFLGKILQKYIKSNFINFLSNIIFILFGIIGLLNIFF